jgi:hypothetical protein
MRSAVDLLLDVIVADEADIRAVDLHVGERIDLTGNAQLRSRRRRSGRTAPVVPVDHQLDVKAAAGD